MSIKPYKSKFGDGRSATPPISPGGRRVYLITHVIARLGPPGYEASRCRPSRQKKSDKTDFFRSKLFQPSSSQTERQFPESRHSTTILNFTPPPNNCHPPQLPYKQSDCCISRRWFQQ